MKQNVGLVHAVDACAERLDQLNERYPELSSSTSIDGVMHWRKRRVQHRLRKRQTAPAEVPGGPDVRAIALGLLKRNGLEDVLDILLERHQVDLSLPKLIHLIGKEAYIASLKREAARLLENAISYEQIAGLWNDLDRPALGSASWSARNISVLAS